MKRDLKMKLFKATVLVKGQVEEVPIWAESIETALEVADAEYGEDNVTRLRPEVTR
ncbi:RNA polymerase inhibitor [Pseudomonas phage Waldo5]|uniref:RNA polymerase inhibitor n=1 Tax=Pseudomonas phage Waldo5 TaxID=2762290 RepID=A0A7G8LJM9_9CAUD|nr:RNA polymerase inhibitor [Pseudomonas phage Waldo5]